VLGHVDHGKATVRKRGGSGGLVIKEVSIGTQVIEDADHSRHVSIIEIKRHIAE
jgi:DNA-binding protein